MEAEVKRLARRGVRGWRETRPDRRDEQTLSYPFEPELAWMAAHYLRSPSRVLWDLYASKATRLEPLYEELRHWLRNERRPWLQDGMGISVRVTGAEDFQAGQLQIQGTVKNAIIDAAADHGMTLHLERDQPDLLITARGTPLTISVDLAGRSMHERGYRLQHGEAPLRETLAAQLLILARWDPRTEVLIDPLCGSGTIPIEAAAMARGEPLWIKPKRPLITRLPLYADRVGQPVPDLFPGDPPPIFGNELDAGTLNSAKKNAERAGSSDRIMFLHGDFRRLDAARMNEALGYTADLSRGLVLTNPPYGERLGDDIELVEQLYRDLWAWCEGLGKGWRAAFLSANPELERIVPRQPVLKKPTMNGPLKAYYLVYEV